MINKSPPLSRDYNRNPNIRALKRRWSINHGSALFRKAEQSSDILFADVKLAPLSAESAEECLNVCWCFSGKGLMIRISACKVIARTAFVLISSLKVSTAPHVEPESLIAPSQFARHCQRSLDKTPTAVASRQARPAPRNQKI